MKKLGVAILGTGAIAPAHVDGFRALDECELRVLCNTTIQKAQKLVDSMGLKADICGDYKEVLAREDIDIVAICLPPKLHGEVTVAALQAGKHVLLEKPMAPSLEECDKILAAQKASGKVLSVVSNNRFKTPAMKVKRLLEEGIGGKLLFTTVNSFWWRGQHYYDLWWRGTWQNECGGCTTSHAVHHIDLMQWMIGMPKKVTAVIGNVGHDNSECEDYAVAILQYPEMVAQMSTNIVSHGGEQEMVFQTEKGKLSIPWAPKAFKALPNGFPESDDAALSAMQARYEELPELKTENHAGQIANFVGAITGKEALLVDGQQGRNAIELIMAIYKSSVTGVPVELPIFQDDAFYRLETMTAVMPRFHQKTRSVQNADTVPPSSFGRDAGK